MKKEKKQEEKNKIVVIDFSIFMFRAIFSWKHNKSIPPTYTALNMIVSCLRKIGIEPTDTVIIACDEGRSWRKEISKEYKANRKEQREKHTDIDWNKRFKEFNDLKDKLQKGTHWNVVGEWTFEADDWMAVACRYFSDKEVILVTYDQDVEQLCTYPNVKIFSPLKKFKSKKGAYKDIKDPEKVLAKKIQKETSDNLNSEIVTADDYEKRKEIVSLLELPAHIEEKIREVYKNLTDKDNIDKSVLPFKNSVAKRINNLYNDKSNIVSYEDCINYRAKKRKKK